MNEADRIKLSLTGMDSVDLGGHREKFEAMVKEIVKDIQSRRSVGKAREITIKLRFEPKPDDDDHIYFGIELGSKIPGYKSDTAKLLVHKNSELSFAGLKSEEEQDK